MAVMKDEDLQRHAKSVAVHPPGGVAKTVLKEFCTQAG